ncbi:MAG: hypothetical protein M1832_001237 [Thelocarpon impressellum]|nr:MAG: hypothetical protein M1832_001237 [Thelocarpon impressellum]
MPAVSPGEDAGSLEDARAERIGRTEEHKDGPLSRSSSNLYTISYLVFFSIWGTLARLGLSSLTSYPGAPDVYGVLWANFTGCLIMGFLLESAASSKTAPVYVGLTSGLCGCLTSFSSFMRDVFFALANELPSPPATTTPRAAGYSVMAALAVPIVTVSVSLCAIHCGAHLAAFLLPRIPPVSPRLHAFLDRATVPLAFGGWIGAVVMCIWPPYPPWRGQALFATALAPPGCLARFYISRTLNPRRAFPLGTFTVNITGTLILGLAWDLQHSHLSRGAVGGGYVACQALQGVQDGFCGCLTTVSTWAAELTTSRRKTAYSYGLTSVCLGLACLVVVMGSLRWTQGFQLFLCG